MSADRIRIASPVPWLPDLPRGVSGSSRTLHEDMSDKFYEDMPENLPEKMSEYMSGFGCMSQVLSVESSPWRPANLAMLRYGFLQKWGIASKGDFREEDDRPLDLGVPHFRHTHTLATNSTSRRFQQDTTLSLLPAKMGLVKLIRHDSTCCDRGPTHLSK